MGSNFNKIFKLLSKVTTAKKNVSLTTLTSFKIGGTAKVVVEPNNLEQIIKVMDILNTYKAKYMVVGNGTNLLVEEYDGVIVKLANNFSKVSITSNVIIAEAGASLNKVAILARDNGLSGMEGLFGIPATVGGATLMNAGAFGMQMSDIVTSVLAITNGKITHYNLQECGFGYRKSIFADSIILRVEFTLKQGDTDKIAVAMTTNMQHRVNSQPLNYPSAGCVFANGEGYYAGKLIDEHGLKGYKVGGAMISPKHANFIVNMGNATFGDVIQLIHYVTDYFKSKNINLNTELKIIHKEKQ